MLSPTLRFPTPGLRSLLQTALVGRANSRTLLASLELRNHRGGYLRLWEETYPGSVAHSAGIDRRIVHSTSVCWAPRNTTDRHISHSRRASGSRKSSHSPQTCVSASVSASRK
jgi:hypothetical protein